MFPDGCFGGGVVRYLGNVRPQSHGMTAMAAPVRRGAEPAIGVITIAGPMMRLTEQRMLELGPQLLATAAELVMASSVSPMLLSKAV